MCAILNSFMSHIGTITALFWLFFFRRSRDTDPSAVDLMVLEVRLPRQEVFMEHSGKFKQELFGARVWGLISHRQNQQD